MKYLYYIIFIVCTLSASIVYLIQEKSPGNQESGLTINDKYISASELKEKYSQSTYPSRKEFIESTITKELLIQEARKNGIDREELFRRSIQNYYEQSLTKILLDRKFNELKVEATKQEINRYLDLHGREISITLIPSLSARQGEGASTLNKETNETILTDIFDNFSDEIKINLLQLAPGEKTKPILISEGKYVIRLNLIGQKSNETDSTIQPDKARKLINEYKREKEVSAWIDRIRKDSSITINENIL